MCASSMDRGTDCQPVIRHCGAAPDRHPDLFGRNRDRPEPIRTHLGHNRDTLFTTSEYHKSLYINDLHN
jgi:hypothetical protein